jgi:hypothetical protein
MNSNKRKAETLGMAHGTANSLLRRNIIYHLLETPVCYRCKEIIERPEDFSIDHIEPWEGRENGKELYWDLENIAFSHKWCNRPHLAVLEPKPLNHGWYGYNKKGCRCDVCKEASQKHNLERYEEGNCRSSTKAV